MVESRARSAEADYPWQLMHGTAWHGMAWDDDYEHLVPPYYLPVQGMHEQEGGYPGTQVPKYLST
jgi:hypothetical protein